MTKTDNLIETLERIQGNTLTYLDAEMAKAATGETQLSSSLLREVVNLIKANKELLTAHQAKEETYHHTMALLENLPDEFPS